MWDCVLEQDTLCTSTLDLRFGKLLLGGCPVTWNLLGQKFWLLISDFDVYILRFLYIAMINSSDNIITVHLR